MWFRGEETPYVQGPNYFKDDLVVSERFPRMTDIPSVSDPVYYWSYALVGKSCNNGSSANSQ